MPRKKKGGQLMEQGVVAVANHLDSLSSVDDPTERRARIKILLVTGALTVRQASDELHYAIRDQQDGAKVDRLGKTFKEVTEVSRETQEEIRKQQVLKKYQDRLGDNGLEALPFNICTRRNKKAERGSPLLNNYVPVIDTPLCADGEVEDISEPIAICTNGLGTAGIIGYSKRVVESCKAKKEFRDEVDTGNCSKILWNLANLWAKKDKKHHFNDSMHVVTLISIEFNYSVEEYVGCRWFKLLPKPSKATGFRLDYERTVDSIDQHLIQKGAEERKYYNTFSAVIDKLFAEINQPSLSFNYNEGIKKFCGTVLTPESFKSKINSMTEYIHLGFIVLRFTFEQRHEFKTEKERIEFFRALFQNCREKRWMACLLYDFACIYDTPQASVQCPHMPAYIADPESVPDKLQSRNQSCPETVIHQIEKGIRRSLKQVKSEVGRSTIGSQRDWLVGRYRICCNYYNQFYKKDLKKRKSFIRGRGIGNLAALPKDGDEHTNEDDGEDEESEAGMSQEEDDNTSSESSPSDPKEQNDEHPLSVKFGDGIADIEDSAKNGDGLNKEDDSTEMANSCGCSAETETKNAGNVSDVTGTEMVNSCGCFPETETQNAGSVCDDGTGNESNSTTPEATAQENDCEPCCGESYESGLEVTTDGKERLSNTITEGTPVNENQPCPSESDESESSDAGEAGKERSSSIALTEGLPDDEDQTCSSESLESGSDVSSEGNESDSNSTAENTLDDEEELCSSEGDESADLQDLSINGKDERSSVKGPGSLGNRINGRSKSKRKKCSQQSAGRMRKKVKRTQNTTKTTMPAKGKPEATAQSKVKISKAKSEAPKIINYEKNRDSVDCTKTLARQWKITIASMSRNYTDRSGMGVYQVKKGLAFDHYYSSLEKRFGRMTWATQEDVNEYNPTLYCSKTNCLTVFRCAPVEMYVARDLRNTYHYFHTIAPEGDDIGMPSALVISRDAKSADHAHFCACRVNWEFFAECFENVKVDFGRLILFVLGAKSKRDSKRDGNIKSAYGTRLDLGMSGMGFYRKRSQEERGIPKEEVCGQEPFKNAEVQGEEIRRDIGQLVDAATLLMDRMHEKYEYMEQRLFENKRRLEKYSSVLRGFLGASYVRAEWITIQIKCLDRGDRTAGHYDESNCPWPGYDATATLSFIFRDAFGVFWSLKIILNSRKIIGDYFIPNFGMLHGGLVRQLESINNEYRHLETSLYKGTFPLLAKNLSARNFRYLFLDDDMPWETELLNVTKKKKGRASSKLAEVWAECFTLIAAPQRDLFLSLMISAIRCSSICHSLSTEEMLKFAIIMSYQNSFKRTFYVMKQYQPKNVKAYYNKMKEVFGTFFGGTDVRYSASGINLEELFFTDGEGDNRLNSVVVEIMKLFSWINSHTMEKDTGPCDADRERVMLVDFEEQVGMAVANLNDMFGKGQKVQIKEFRMLLIVQTCALAGIGLKEHPILTKLVYVVEGTGGHNFLYKKNDGALDKSKRQYGFTTDEIMSTLGDALQLEKHDIGNAMEGIACEAQPKRREGNVRDVFMKGQDLFTLDRFGRRYIKKYGSILWEFLDAEHHGVQYPKEQP